MVFALLGILGVMLLWKHSSGDEKSVLRAVLLGIALVPLLIAWEGSMCSHLDARQGLSLYHQAWSRGYDGPLVERAAALRLRTREDSLYRALALSLQYKKQGNYLRAADWAREASRIEPAGDLSLLNTQRRPPFSRPRGARRRNGWRPGSIRAKPSCTTTIRRSIRSSWIGPPKSIRRG